MDKGACVQSLRLWRYSGWGYAAIYLDTVVWHE
jgi:hypothetical protein